MKIVWLLLAISKCERSYAPLPSHEVNVNLQKLQELQELQIRVKRNAEIPGLSKQYLRKLLTRFDTLTPHGLGFEYPFMNQGQLATMVQRHAKCNIELGMRLAAIKDEAELQTEIIKNWDELDRLTLPHLRLIHQNLNTGIWKIPLRYHTFAAEINLRTKQMRVKALLDIRDSNDLKPFLQEHLKSLDLLKKKELIKVLKILGIRCARKKDTANDIIRDLIRESISVESSPRGSTSSLLSLHNRQQRLLPAQAPDVDLEAQLKHIRSLPELIQTIRENETKIDQLSPKCLKKVLISFHGDDHNEAKSIYGTMGKPKAVATVKLYAKCNIELGMRLAAIKDEAELQTEIIKNWDELDRLTLPHLRLIHQNLDAEAKPLKLPDSTEMLRRTDYIRRKALINIKEADALQTFLHEHRDSVKVLKRKQLMDIIMKLQPGTSRIGNIPKTQAHRVDYIHSIIDKQQTDSPPANHCAPNLLSPSRSRSSSAHGSTSRSPPPDSRQPRSPTTQHSDDKQQTDSPPANQCAPNLLSPSRSRASSAHGSTSRSPPPESRQKRSPTTQHSDLSKLLEEIQDTENLKIALLLLEGDLKVLSSRQLQNILERLTRPDDTPWTVQSERNSLKEVRAPVRRTNHLEDDAQTPQSLIDRIFDIIKGQQTDSPPANQYSRKSLSGSCSPSSSPHGSPPDSRQQRSLATPHSDLSYKNKLDVTNISMDYSVSNGQEQIYLSPSDQSLPMSNSADHAYSSPTRPSKLRSPSPNRKQSKLLSRSQHDPKLFSLPPKNPKEICRRKRPRSQHSYCDNYYLTPPKRSYDVSLGIASLPPLSPSTPIKDAQPREEAQEEATRHEELLYGLPLEPLFGGTALELLKFD